jgi:hypothetical protein
VVAEPVEGWTVVVGAVAVPLSLACTRPQNRQVCCGWEVSGSGAPHPSHRLARMAESVPLNCRGRPSGEQGTERVAAQDRGTSARNRVR